MTRAAYKNFSEKVEDHRLIFEEINFALISLNETIENIEVIWSNKLKRTAGTAFQGKIITISNELWYRANEQQKREIVIHETCHLVVQTRNKRNNYVNAEYRDHGKSWQECMRICGHINPKTCHTIPVKRRLFLYICPCIDGLREHKIKVRLHNQYMRKEIDHIKCKMYGNKCEFVKEIID